MHMCQAAIPIWRASLGHVSSSTPFISGCPGWLLARGLLIVSSRRGTVVLGASLLAEHVRATEVLLRGARRAPEAQGISAQPDRHCEQHLQLAVL
jgi:hypothetical protein